MAVILTNKHKITQNTAQLFKFLTFLNYPPIMVNESKLKL